MALCEKYAGERYINKAIEKELKTKTAKQISDKRRTISLQAKKQVVNDDDEFRFNDASTHEGHLRQNGELTWFCNETIIMISHKCIKCKTRTNLKIKAVILC